jgi:hypothetical protein
MTITKFSSRLGVGAVVATASLILLESNAALAADAPSAPILTGPTGTVGTTLPTYRWFSLVTASEYFLWVNDASGPRIQQIYSAAAAGCPTGGFCRITPTQPVHGNVTFWVQARTPFGSSAWSAPLSFTVVTDAG